MDQLENLFTQYKQTKFATRAADVAAKKDLRKQERQINSAITNEFMTITDAATAKAFMSRQQQFDAAFTFTPEATCEAELDFNF